MAGRAPLPQKEHTFEQWAWRFPVPMFEDMPTIEGHTRFHRQFITLARRHAQIISDDVEVFELFKKALLPAA